MIDYGFFELMSTVVPSDSGESHQYQRTFRGEPISKKEWKDAAKNNCCDHLKYFSSRTPEEKLAIRLRWGENLWDWYVEIHKEAHGVY